MGQEKQKPKSRRQFFQLLTGQQKSSGNEMVKMLTPDGKLVEVKKSVIDAATNRKPATNTDIYDWMQNPSKNNES